MERPGDHVTLPHGPACSERFQQLDALRAQERELAERLKKEVEEGKAKVETVRGMLRVVCLDSVTFATGSDRITPKGKEVLAKIAEGRAVSDAVDEAGVAFQIGTFKRYGNAKNKSHVVHHKIIKHGLLKDLDGTVYFCGAKNRTGKTGLTEQPVPSTLDYDMWLGPAPYKPYNSARVHYSNRFYWDYEGGGLTDMAQHHFDPVVWTYAKDATSPVEVEAYAPPAHPEAVPPSGADC